MRRSQTGGRPRAIAALALFVSAVAVTGGAVSLRAQPSAAPASVLTGVFSASQAERGERKFKEACVSCHNIAELGGSRFRSAWKDQSLGDLFDFLTNAMPQGDPGSLTADEYTSLIAYILSQSGYPAGSQDLPAGKAALAAFRLMPLP